MYKLSIPVMVTARTFDPAAILADLRACGADRVFLAIPPLTTDEAAQARNNQKLADAIAFFKGKGIEVGVWFWAFWVEGTSDFTRITGVNGSKTRVNMCPLDENFLAFMEHHLSTVAAMHPDLIQFDDDFRFSELSCGMGCACPLHLAAAEKTLGKPMPRENLMQVLFGGKKNEYRSAFLRANGDSFRQFSRRARAAVDRVDPSVRLGQCACIGTFDYDGTDSFEISRILAGNTKPFVRLIGAPYWAERQNWGNRLGDVIDLERLEASWNTDPDIEIFSEGDAYPRPRFHVPAAYVELFDAALRADGGLGGILKYMMDYTSSSRYERGYMNRHIADAPMKETLSRVFSDKQDNGIRVYDSMKKIEDADFSLRRVSESVVQDQFYSKASRMLSAEALPACYRGQGCAGITFGENARHLPSYAYEKPLILDACAARILTESGVDVGAAAFGAFVSPAVIRDPETDEDVRINAVQPYMQEITPAENASVRCQFVTPDGRAYPFCYTYENGNGQRFIVFTFDSDIASEEIWRNYENAALLNRILTAWGTPIPVQCPNAPDLHIIVKDGTGANGSMTRAVGFFNCFADFITDAEITIPGTWSHASFHGCSGSLTETGIRIDRINAYEYCFVELA